MCGFVLFGSTWQQHRPPRNGCVYCALIVGLESQTNDEGRIYNHRYSDGKNLNLYRNIYVRKFNA